MRTYPIKYYKSGILRKWRWTIKADNGNIIGASTQGYWNKLDCVDNATLVGQCLLQNKDLSK